MWIRKNLIFKYLTLIFSFCFSYGLIYISDNIILHIISMILFCMINIILVDFDLLHPYFWFSSFFTLYSVAYPIIIAMGFPSKIGYTKETMIYQLIALFILLIVISPKKYLNFNKENNMLGINLGIFNKIIYCLLITIIIYAGIYVAKAGFNGKEEIYTLGGAFLTKIFRIPLILNFSYTLFFVSKYSQNKKLPINQIFITGFALLFLTLFSGERDFIFRFIILTAFILWYFKLLKLKGLILLVPLFILIIPLSSAYKYYFLNGNVSIINKNILYSFLSGEFESSARNLQLLINNSPTTKGCKGLTLIFRNILSVFNSNIDSPSTWFDKTFYSTSKTQYGFTLVGEGYIMCGLIGIVILFIILGFIIKIFYKNANNSIYALTSYFYFSTIMIYAIRCDFGLILSSILKQIGFVVVILWFTERLSKQPIKQYYET